MKKLLVVLSTIGATLAMLAGALPASATPLRGIDGFDVSYPQCGQTLPAPGAFSIIGVDDGRAYHARESTCLVSQLVWAKNAQSSIQLYANTGNPGGPWIWDSSGTSRTRLTISNWPSRVSGTNSTKPRICTASNPDTYNCAYDYGFKAAAQSFARARSAFTAAGISYSPASVNWWLDIEWGIVNGVNEGNTWRGHDPDYVHPNDSLLTMAQKNARNIWTLRGMHDYLVDVAKVKQLGFYSAPNAWATVVGGTRAFADHPFWYPIGGATNDEAVAKCATWATDVTGAGQPSMVQYVDTDLHLDMSVRCEPGTTIAYQGARSVLHGTAFTLLAKLVPVNGSYGLHGQTVTFTFAGKTYSTRTDALGYARVRNVVARAAGVSTVTVNFAGNSYAASTNSADITIR